MNVNWKVRLKNKQFWIAMIPAFLLMVQTILQVFNVGFDFTGISNQLIAVVNTVFAFLTIIGVVADPTTPGIGDSQRALTYCAPGQTNDPVEEEIQ